MVSPKPIRIRQALIEDSDAIATLASELGYPTSDSAMKAQLEKLLKQSEEAIFVSLAEDRVIGWLHLSLLHSLIHDDHVLINAFIVSESWRGQKIGAQLLRTAEQWAQEHGLNVLVVRSNMTRKDAHRFYLREGFQHIKTSAVFEKHLFCEA